MKKSNLIIGMALAAGLLMSSCTKENGIIVGQGPVITETLDLDQFSRITMNGAEKVYITYGNEQEVKVTGHGNIIDRIKTRVTNETWTMELERGVYGNYHLSYEITLPKLEEITNNGASDIEVYEFIPQDDFTVVINGAGNFKGFNMPVKECRLEISGLGYCEISVEETLDVTISGAGKVYYKGEPHIHQNISGLGSIINVD